MSNKPQSRITTRKVKVEGGFTPTWRSDILGSERVGRAVNYVGKEFKDVATRRAEAAAAKYNPAVKLDYYYGSKILNGKWGKTYVLWPTNKISRFEDNQEIVADVAFHLNLKKKIIKF